MKDISNSNEMLVLLHALLISRGRVSEVERNMVHADRDHI